jgi:hypothetical protein
MGVRSHLHFLDTRLCFAQSFAHLLALVGLIPVHQICFVPVFSLDTLVHSATLSLIFCPFAWRLYCKNGGIRAVLSPLRCIFVAVSHWSLMYRAEPVEAKLVTVLVAQLDILE